MILSEKSRNQLMQARKRAVIWHNSEKEKRIKKAKVEADEILKKLDITNKNTASLAFSLLYMGEGMKKKETAMGNSDPLILKFFIACLNNIFSIEKKSISCELHLRFDQNETELKNYWSNQLDIPIHQFKKTSFDKRTFGKPTFSDYKGVCVVRCGNIAIQRKLGYLSKKFCEMYVSTRD